MQKHPPRIPVLQPNGALTPATATLLHAATGVSLELLQAARIRPSRSNWLHAPWYPYHRGGAITIGRTIWFTRKWFAPTGYGDGSVASTRKWLLHLAHEVGHLPQAERFGRTTVGKVRYVLAFTAQYTFRFMACKRPVHDGSPLEMEADRGRQRLLGWIGDEARHPLILAVHEQDRQAVLLACANLKEGRPSTPGNRA